MKTSRIFSPVQVKTMGLVLALTTVECSPGPRNPRAVAAPSLLEVLRDGADAGAESDAEVAPPFHRLGVLTREEASRRSQQVSRVSYRLRFDLTGDRADPVSRKASENQYRGTAAIDFDLAPNANEVDAKLFVDFEGGSVISLTLNGRALADLSGSGRADGHRIYFRVDELSAKVNRLEIEFVHPFSKDGTGLHHFRDPEDQRTYLYSNFEPFNAHRMFPCFDQPDINVDFASSRRNLFV